MIQVNLSHRMETLARALVENLALERDQVQGDPFHAPVILVSSVSIRTWLAFEIARLTGAAAHLGFRYLESFLREQLAGLDPPLRLPGKDLVGVQLLHVLADEPVLHADTLAPVRDYLNAGGPDRDVIDRRRLQLAGRLARLFDDYALHRPELIAAWRAGEYAVAATSRSTTELWERALWQEVFGPAGRLARARTENTAGFTTLDAAARAAAEGRLRLPPHLHLFGFSHFAETYHQLLESIASHTTIHVYTLHPEDPARAGHSSSTAMKLWGGPARAHLERLRGHTAEIQARFDPQPDVPDASPLTLLGCVQHDVLTGTRGSSPCTVLPNDHSIRVLACPDPRREMEILAAEIWELVRSEPDIRFHEIAVLINPAVFETYETHVASVFPEAHDLPFTMIDLAGRRGSRIVDAVAGLIELPFTRFERPALLGLLTHPVIAGRVPHADVESWIQWCERTGMYHGADQRDLADTYLDRVDRPLVHWDQGLVRLALGAFMTGEASGDDRLFDPDRTRRLPEEIAAGQTASAGAFVLLARSLLADARFARHARFPLATWARFLHRYLATYVAPPKDAGAEEENQLARCLAAVEELARLDLDGEPVSYRVAADLVQAALDRITGRRGRHLADGVVVSSFQPMRAVPFRAVFLAGLNEGTFPADDPRDPLDLRAAEVREGDVSRRDRDRHTFLEALISARTRLTLSYVRRDARTGERLLPSPVVTELLDWIEQRPGHGPTRADLEVEHPLARDHDAYFGSPADTRYPTALPAARAEAVARRLGENLREACKAQAMPVPGFAELPPLTQQRLAQALAVADLPARPAKAMATETTSTETRPDETLSQETRPAHRNDVLEIPLARLKRFLECPLQGWARHVLGLHEEEDQDPVRVEDEPFAASRLDSTMLLRQAFAQARMDPRKIAAVYDERTQRAEATGRWPAGFFREAARRDHLAALASWQECYANIPGGPEALVSVAIGRTNEHANADRFVPPITVTLPGLPDRDRTDSQTIRLSGRTGLVTARYRVAVRPVMRDKAKVRDFVAGWIDLMALAASGLGEPDGRLIAVLTRSARPAKHDVRPIAGSLTPERATAYLATLVAELLGRSHDYLLPIEWVEQLVEKKKPYEDLDRDKVGETATAYGPVVRLDDFDPPSPEEARIMIQRRFEGFPWKGGA